MPDNLFGYITSGMGNARSKPKDRSTRARSESSTLYTDEREDFSADINQRFAEDEQLRILRHTIRYNPDLFVLNNLMMSVEFFENYDKEILDIREKLVSSREAELNANLPPQKHALIPDVLQQHVARNVHFTYVDPDCRLTEEPLHPIRIYVSHENIEVTEQSYASHYSHVNQATIYYMQLKPSSTHKGYVLLRRLEVSPPKKRTPNGTDDRDSSIYSDTESLYGKDEGLYQVRGGTNVFDDSNVKSRKTARLPPSTDPSIAGSSASSGYRSAGNYIDSSESDCSYPRTCGAGGGGSYYTDAPKTSKSSLESGSIISNTEIPERCFRKIEYTREGKIYDSGRERRQLRLKSTTEQLIRQAYYNSGNYSVAYLISAKFMKYFCHLFADQLAERMDFDFDTDGNRSDCHDEAICLTKVEVLDGTTKLEQFEIVPSIGLQWPRYAQEWLDRTRGNWPRDSVIERVKEFGCHAIPKGIISSTERDAYRDLEWQLVFPAAERYLETCLTYPQVRVYLMALMLRKTFVRPAGSIFGLTVSHIKNSLFWLVEGDVGSSMWTENRTGEALVKLLNALYRSISQDTPNLPDYFVREKNLFREKSCLLLTQKQLKRIIENPVMYVFHAMENIRHSRKFFPRLDFEELFRILTADKVTLGNPELLLDSSPAPRSVPPRTYENHEGNYDHRGGSFWDKSNQRNTEERRIYGVKPATKRNLVNTRRACDQIVEIQVRCEKLEPERMSYLLDFFVKHFIQMAERCHSYLAMSQKMAYVDQAERLSILLAEYTTHRDNAKNYLEKLNKLRRLASGRSRVPQNASDAAGPAVPSNPPETPRRNPDRAIWTIPLKHRYESPENLGIEKQSLATSTDPTESPRDTGITRVVSIADTPLESFLTETTYI